MVAAVSEPVGHTSVAPYAGGGAGGGGAGKGGGGRGGGGRGGGGRGGGGLGGGEGAQVRCMSVPVQERTASVPPHELGTDETEFMFGSQQPPHMPGHPGRNCSRELTLSKQNCAKLNVVSSFAPPPSRATRRAHAAPQNLAPTSQCIYSFSKFFTKDEAVLIWRRDTSPATGRRTLRPIMPRQSSRRLLVSTVSSERSLLLLIEA